MNQRERHLRLVEMVLLYFALPGALTLARLFLASFPVIPVLWIVALPVAFWLVRGNHCSSSRLLGLDTIAIRERELTRIVLQAIPAMILLVAVLRRIHPDWLLSLPRDKPLLWAFVLVAYPVLSVFPQGILYRAFFKERYAELFPNPVARTLVAASCFSFCHIFFLNPWALLLTFVGGILFYRTYERTGSLFLSSVEHSFYGDLVFTLGYGPFLYHGTLVMAAQALG